MAFSGLISLQQKIKQILLYCRHLEWDVVWAWTQNFCEMKWIISFIYRKDEMKRKIFYIWQFFWIPFFIQYYLSSFMQSRKNFFSISKNHENVRIWNVCSELDPQRESDHASRYIYFPFCMLWFYTLCSCSVYLTWCTICLCCSRTE